MTARDDAIEAVAAGMWGHHAGVNSQPKWPDLGEPYRSLWLGYASEAIAALTALGAVMPDEAAKLRATAKRAAVLQRIAERNTRQAEADLAEANEREAQFDARLAGLEAAHARRWQRWGEERDQLRDRVERAEEQVADALALCTEIRPDSVLGTSDTERLKAVRERLAMPVGGEGRG